MKTFCNIFLSLMLLSILVMFVMDPFWMAGFCLLYSALMWALNTGKRKAAKRRDTQF